MWHKWLASKQTPLLHGYEKKDQNVQHKVYIIPIIIDPIIIANITTVIYTIQPRLGT